VLVTRKSFGASLTFEGNVWSLSTDKGAVRCSTQVGPNLTHIYQTIIEGFSDGEQSLEKLYVVEFSTLDMGRL
jgi:hypothetical protein